MNNVAESGFYCFTSPYGLDGMAKQTGKRLDLLAVAAQSPGSGQWRNFLAQAKIEFEQIVIWELWNADFAQRLRERYGFRDATDFNEVDNRFERVVIWEKINATP